MHVVRCSHHFSHLFPGYFVRSSPGHYCGNTLCWKAGGTNRPNAVRSHLQNDWNRPSNCSGLRANTRPHGRRPVGRCCHLSCQNGLFQRHTGPLSPFGLAQLICSVMAPSVGATSHPCSYLPWQGLTKSVLNDYVSKANRAKWNSLESINVFSWSGSAALGGKWFAFLCCCPNSHSFGAALQGTRFICVHL